MGIVHSLMASFGMNIAPMQSELNKAEAHAAKTGQHVKESLTQHVGGEVGLGLIEGLGVITAIAAAVAATVEGMFSAIEYGSKINDLSERLGISTDAVQEWDYALKQTGTSIDSAVGFFEKLAVAKLKAIRGDETAIANFKKLGVAMEDLKSKRIEDIAAQISGAFRDGDPQILIAPLRVVGGRGAGEMVAAFTEGFAELKSQAHQFGQVMDEETVGKMDEIGDAIERLKTGMKLNLFAPAASMLLSAADIFKQYVGGFLASLVNGTNPIADFAKDAKDREWEKYKKDADAASRKAGINPRTGEPIGAIDKEDTAKDKKEIDRLNKQTALEERRGQMASMNGDQKLEFLKEELAHLEDISAHETDSIEKAKLELEIQKDKNTIADEQRKIDKDYEKEMKKMEKGDRQHAVKTQVNSLQQIGGFIGSYVKAPEVVMLDTAKASEGHLKTIKEHLHAIRGATKPVGAKSAKGKF